MNRTYSDCVDEMTALGLPNVFPFHLLKFWTSGVPAVYAVACLRAGNGVSQVIEMWQRGIPLEYAQVT